MGFSIGNVRIKNRIVLAPMAGISNPAYMKICSEMKVGLAITELISAEAIVRNNKKTFEMLNGIDTLDIPVGIQIFGSDPDTLALAAKILCDNFKKISLIDINMGCPVPKVSIKSGAGSALLKNPEKIYNIVSKVVSNVNVPVTVKIRSGWDSNSINAIEVAKKIESAGASAITIHARTRSQGYSGLSDWNIIKIVKENVSIPVIGNGDIKSCYDAKKMIEQTNCDAVMIGRAALGNPWIIKECVEYLEENKIPSEVTIEEKINKIKKHVNYLLDIKDEQIAILEMRSNTCWYLKGMPNTSKIKEQINKVKTKNELFEILDKYKEENYEF
ncbi:MAG: tRNA dihydrouridine synthase DusB [Clostridium sp.]|nr:tRNA dihydrouridine synthase DusB [Clostridium sp.]MCM1444746.1 tRNA dihydrouridine synthase DusB [Candidatus Amulumruptor caecigallinarius]